VLKGATKMLILQVGIHISTHPKVAAQEIAHLANKLGITVHGTRVISETPMHADRGDTEEDVFNNWKLESQLEKYPEDRTDANET